MTKSLSMMILAALAAPVSASDESSDQELVSAPDHATDNNAAPQLRGDGDEQVTMGKEQLHTRKRRGGIRRKVKKVNRKVKKINISSDDIAANTDAITAAEADIDTINTTLDDIINNYDIAANTNTENTTILNELISRINSAESDIGALGASANNDRARIASAEFAIDANSANIDINNSSIDSILLALKNRFKDNRFDTRAKAELAIAERDNAMADL